MAFPVELLECPACSGRVAPVGPDEELACERCGRRSRTVSPGYLDMLREPGRPDPAPPTPAQRLMESRLFVRMYETAMRPFFARVFAGPGAHVPSPAEEFEIYRDWLGLAGSTGSWLDLSCGAGYFTRLMAGTAPAATVVGLDISTAMLERAAGHGAGSPNLRWVRGDVRRLPFRDGSFDGVSNPGSLHLYADPDAAFREVFRLLKPGGRFAASTFAESGRPLGRHAARLLGVRRTDLGALPRALAAAGFVDYRLRRFGDAFVAGARRPEQGRSE
ncbi:MAG: methyltransferase domain-containing protein [Mycobacteriales bacterium]